MTCGNPFFCETCQSKGIHYDSSCEALRLLSTVIFERINDEERSRKDHGLHLSLERTKNEAEGHQLQRPTAIAATTTAETTTIEDKLFEKMIVLEEIEPSLFTGFEDTTTLEDKKSLTVFSAIAVVRCISCRTDPSKLA